jgi:hypothetical protein
MTSISNDTALGDSPVRTLRAALAAVRSASMAWAAAALLPLPSLLIIDPASSANVALLYLGLACAWLAVEMLRTHLAGLPDPGGWNAGILAVFLAVSVNVGLFIALGAAVGVRSNLPFPLLAVLSAVPAIGLVPWLLLRVHQPYAAIFLAAMITLAAKLAACVVARIVYGPDYIERGYVSADWRSAKLMITLFWGFTFAISVLAFFDARRRTAHRYQLPA